MYDFNSICCICLLNNTNLQQLLASEREEWTYYAKLVSCIPEMDFEEMNDHRLICGGCCDTLDTLYKFRQNCLRSKTIFMNYISQLHTNHNTSNENVICLTNIKKENDIGMDCQNVNNENNSNLSFTNEKNNTDNFTDINCQEIKIEPGIEIIKPENDSYAKNNEYFFTNDIKKENDTIEQLTEEVDLDIKCNNNQDVNVGENCSFAFVDINDIGSRSRGDVLKQHLQPESDLFTVGCISSTLDTQVENEMISNTIPQKDIHSLEVMDLEANSANNSNDVNKPKILKKHECSLCNKEFRQSSHYKEHMRTHTGEKPYECNICNKNFSTSTNLSRHMKTHSGEPPYECELCKKKYNDSSNLSVHMRIHTGNQPYQCNICLKKFNYHITYTRHMRMHSGDKPFECNICNKKFTNKTNFVNHTRAHSGEKPHECNMCNKKFGRLVDLIVHNRTHTGEKPHVCKICNKGFGNSSTLCRHIRTHTGEKPSECSICNRRFANSSTLCRHMRTHTGEKPHECNVCNKRFSQSGMLTRHMKVHTETK